MAALLVSVGLLGLVSASAEAALRVEGQVQAGGGAVAGSTVAVWAGSAGAPARLTQATTGADGNFVVTVDQTPSGSVLYLVATGGTPTISRQAGNNPALALLAVLGGNPPAHVVINEMTTVASVWTNAQFLDGTAIKGSELRPRPGITDWTEGDSGLGAEAVVSRDDRPRADP